VTTIRFTRLPASHESYGAVMALLMENGGYETANFGPLARAVAAQVRDGSHLAAFMGNRLVAYVGALPVRPDAAADWLRDAGELQIMDVAETRATTVTVSVICTNVPGVGRRLLLAFRHMFPGARVVFRRDYGGRRPARKAQVMCRDSR
jgi:hypothetical protein